MNLRGRTNSNGAVRIFQSKFIIYVTNTQMISTTRQEHAWREQNEKDHSNKDGLPPKYNYQVAGSGI